MYEPDDLIDRDAPATHIEACCDAKYTVHERGGQRPKSMLAAMKKLLEESRREEAAAAEDAPVEEDAPSIDLAPGLEDACAAAARHAREGELPAVVARRRHWYAAERCAPVVIDDLLTPADVEALHAAAAALTARGQEPREFRDATAASNHGVCYLHAGGFVQREAPELVERLVDAMVERAPGAWPGDFSDLRVRCVELHTYAAGSGLFLKNHRDNDSALTLSARLSPAGAHGGGRFVTYGARGRPVAHALGPGAAVLFPSEKLHNVERVTSGVRYSLVVELWAGPTNAKDRFT